MNSAEYWESRYRRGDNSGAGSRGRLAEFKAEIINGFVSDFEIENVIEFGCGDGKQLSLAKYQSYIGFDVSAAAVLLCKQRFADDDTKRFSANYAGEVCDLTLSLDVIYHLLEDEVFNEYMATLFGAARRLVIIYSNNFDKIARHHCRPRQFTKWVERNAPEWALLEHIPNRYPFISDVNNESDSDFYIYHRAN